MPLPAGDTVLKMEKGGVGLVLMYSHDCSSLITRDVLLGHATGDLVLGSLKRKSPFVPKIAKYNPRKAIAIIQLISWSHSAASVDRSISLGGRNL